MDTMIENDKNPYLMAIHMKKSKTFKALFALVITAVFFAATYIGGVSVVKILYPLKYDEFVEVYTEEYNLEKSFVYAVIKCESNFDKKAVSSVGARGLMQIMPETFVWLKSKTGEDIEEKMLFDPETAIKYGCLMYEILLKEFESKETAVAAYHAGFGNVLKWLKDKRYSSDGVHLDDIPFPSTKAYVKRVVQTEEIYEKLYKQRNL